VLLSSFAGAFCLKQSLVSFVGDSSSSMVSVVALALAFSFLLVVGLREACLRPIAMKF